MSEKFPKAPRGVEAVVISPEVWDAVVTELERLGKWSVTGADFKNDESGFGLAVSSATRTSTVVQITALETGIGKYAGVTLKGSASIDPAVDFTATDLAGTGGIEVLILNLYDIGATAHALTVSARPLMATPMGVADEDGRPIVVVDAGPWYDCPEP